MTAPLTVIDFHSRRTQDKGRREANKLARRLRRLTGQAILDYHMIGEGDRVMVCLSGGKDSYGMLDVLLFLQSRAPVSFDLIAVNIDQGHPGFPQEVLPNYLSARAVPFHIEHQDTHRIVTRVIEEGQTMCSLCSRLRRGILYRLADELGATRIALGHHREDVLETFFLNMFHGGKLKAMPPKLLSDDGRHVVIRPMVYCAEEDLADWAEVQQFPIIPCNLCGNQEKSERRALKAMLKEWSARYPGRIEAMFRSLSHITPSHLLDGALWDFAALGKRTD